ncbi:hypothetical protein TRAPUB_2107 [Trametes pubescens]|uniref:Uncharacterized protein n=1 Tax=Trametes pubescens TaxID=154538 RepID=A0A1M2VHJ0_TRAPU|nr:hypothetical protein TRAPUB_2107 [Trametes pubescens]
MRKVHVDKATLPPATPQSYPPDLESADRARQFQTQLTRMIRGGATASDLHDVQSELKPWLSTQGADDHADLRATYTLLYRLLKGKQDLAEVEHHCADLKAQIEAERLVAAAKYEELEKRSFEERELLLNAEKALNEENARLRDEVEDLKFRLSDELKELKGNPLPPLPRSIEARHFYLHDLGGAKGDPIAILKDSPDSANAVKVQLIGSKDSFFQLSPVPHTMPDLPSGLMTFQPLTDDIDEAADDDRSMRSSRLSAPRAIPIQSKSPSYRSQPHPTADPDAMAISVPRSTMDVHMASVSSSPNVSTMHYSSRPVEFVSNSVGRVPENALGLRTVDPVRMSPTTINPEVREQQERRERLAQLKEVLNDPVPSPRSSLSRKPTLSDASDRSRSVAPSGLSSTRTPSPVSSTSHSYSASTLDKEYALRHQLLEPRAEPRISSASAAALEHQQRTRASSTASTTAAPAPSSLTHATATRDRDPAPPMHAIYAPAPPPASPARPVQPRRQSTDTTSISKGKASAMGLGPAGSYPSGLTRSMRAMQEAPRVS